MRTADGKIYSAANYTRAIKKANQFTLLHSQRSADLSDPTYILNKDRGTVFSLGSYNPQLLQLFYQIWVGAAEREFRYFQLSDDFGLIQVPFANFRIILIWCFLTLPSDVTASWQSYETKTDDELAAMSPERRKVFDWLPDGVDERQAVDGFRSIRGVFRDMHFEAMSREWPETIRGRDLRVVRGIGGKFCREGLLGTADFEEHIARCRLAFSDEDGVLFHRLTTARSATEYWE
jgi:hypothetical protein